MILFQLTHNGTNFIYTPQFSETQEVKCIKFHSTFLK